MPNKIKEESDFEDGDQLDESYDELDTTAPDVSRGGRTRAGAKDKASGYQLKNVLKLPRATTYSTQAIYDQVHGGDIDLSPEYQRDVVWPDSKQIGLIDSILRNFYIPPVIFVTHQHDDGAETKTCIDGKQRLTSIQRFMDGEIPHKDPENGDKYFYKSSAASQSGRSMLLPERYKRLFANKQIVCIEYQDLPDADEREIFQRVQLGMALTPAEKLQVINSPMASFVRTLQTQYLESGGLSGDELDWDHSRGGDFRCLTQALYLISKYPQQMSVGSIQQLEKWLLNPTARPTRKKKSKGRKSSSDDGENEGDPDLSQDTSFLEKIHSTFQTFAQLVTDSALRPLFLKEQWRVAPIEFVMMCLLISVEKDTLPLKVMAEKMGEMRMITRAEHLDIRTNSRVAKTMFDFISRGTETKRSVNGTKRKRGVSGDDDELQRKNKDPKVVGDATATASPRMPPPPRPATSLPTEAIASVNSTFTPSHTPVKPPSVSIPTIIAPPRPIPQDRLQAVREAKRNASPLPMAPPLQVAPQP
ncbi:hypothetical protein V8B97DRAFT_1942097 [Scleroderma yunnanense]